MHKGLLKRDWVVVCNLHEIVGSISRQKIQYFKVNVYAIQFPYNRMQLAYSLKLVTTTISLRIRRLLLSIYLINSIERCK